MKKGGFMKDAIILFVITLVAGLSLGAVYQVTNCLLYTSYAWLYKRGLCLWGGLWKVSGAGNSCNRNQQGQPGFPQAVCRKI